MNCLGKNLSPTENHSAGVDDNDILSRFINRRKDKSVSFTHFMPRIRENKLIPVSLCLISEIKGDIWEFANDHVFNNTKQKVKSRADIKAYYFFQNELTLSRDDNPFLGHVNVVDWPPEEVKQQLKATALADKAEFIPM